MKGNGIYDMKEYRCVIYAGETDNCVDTFDIKICTCQVIEVIPMMNYYY